MPAPNDDLLDRALIAEFQQVPGEGGQSLFEELRELYLQNGPGRLTQLREASADPVKLAFHAHALKSMSLNIGARGMVDLAQRLEKLGRAGSVEGAGEILDRLQVVFEGTRAQLLALARQ